MRISVVSALPLVLLGVLVGGGAFAAADSLITSSDIKDSSVQNRDVRKGAITMSRLAETTQELINEGGKPGRRAGRAGSAGSAGDAGSARRHRADPDEQQLRHHLSQHERVAGRGPALRTRDAAPRRRESEHHRQSG